MGRAALKLDNFRKTDVAIYRTSVSEISCFGFRVFDRAHVMTHKSRWSAKNSPSLEFSYGTPYSVQPTLKGLNSPSSRTNHTRALCTEYVTFSDRQ
jgi:hypothetical protein